ncbi:MAG: hypothetical protein RLO17_23610 [Cyclobacteriaceae bacterium]|jgi:hypothetical protein|tara:strand:- start:3377 stop:3793 length:417 start_codon:yes stop_codon:yes gene_type:complete
MKNIPILIVLGFTFLISCSSSSKNSQISEWVGSYKSYTSENPFAEVSIVSDTLSCKIYENDGSLGGTVKGEVFESLSSTNITLPPFLQPGIPHIKSVLKLAHGYIFKVKEKSTDFFLSEYYLWIPELEHGEPVIKSEL